ncbi:CPK11 [Symbiodinium sp. CCMP2592]|nr:CPK11 [Symbiodinium sp. CCMP2592]
MAAMMANLPEVYCSHSSLKAVFHFFDSSGHGIIQGEQLHLLFPARPEDECALMIRQSCGKDSMSFLDFRRVMTPANWKPSGSACSLAKWAEVPDVTSPVLGPKPKLLKDAATARSARSARSLLAQPGAGAAAVRLLLGSRTGVPGALCAVPESRVPPSADFRAAWQVTSRVTSTPSEAKIRPLRSLSKS